METRGLHRQREQLQHRPGVGESTESLGAERESCVGWELRGNQGKVFIHLHQEV